MAGEVCGVCGQDGWWWRSKTGERVCLKCWPHCMDALEVLARRRPGGVKRVQSWWAGLASPSRHSKWDSDVTGRDTRDA
jgi:hypothetical protein